MVPLTANYRHALYKEQNPQSCSFVFGTDTVKWNLGRDCVDTRVQFLLELVKGFTFWRQLGTQFIIIKFILEYLVHFGSTVNAIFSPQFQLLLAYTA